MTRFGISDSGDAQRGFTLIELLVAISLFSLVMVVALGGLRFATQAWERTGIHADGASEIRTVHRLLNDFLEQALPPASRDRALFEAGPQVLRFAIAVDEFPGRPGLYALQIEAGAGIHGRQYLRLSRRRLGAETMLNGNVEDRVLMETPYHFRFSYFGVPAEASAPAWHEEWRWGRRLPQLVRLELLADDGSPVWPAIIVRPKWEGRS